MLPGKVKLELPAVAVNGHSVAMTVKVDSPMSAAEHVRAVHLVSEKNPVREIDGTQRITAITAKARLVVA